MTSPSQLLHQLLDRAAELHPRAVAVRDDRSSATYAELDELSRHVAHRLGEAGLSVGSRVLIVAKVDVGLPALLYGCSRAGAVFVVLHPQSSAATVRHVMGDCEPSLVVTDRDDVRVIAEDLGVAPAHGIEALVPSATPGQAPAAVPRLPTSVDPACFIYTSGTTSLPRAVVSTHQQMCFAVQAIASQLQYRADDVVFCALPLSFDYGLYQLFLAAAAGAQVVLAAKASAGPPLVGDLAESGATVLPAVPSIAQNLARLLAHRRRRLERLRLLTNTGGTIPDQTLTTLRQQLPHLRVQLMYGLTECKRAAIMPPDEDLRRPGRCGRALPGTEIRILDDEGEEVPHGHIGEIVIRGPHVMVGYWRQPSLTARTFVCLDGISPALRSGDYGSVDDDGYLIFAGRRDDLYKERDVRVSAVEVVNAATAVAGVEAAHVLVPRLGRPRAVLVVTGHVEPAEVLRTMATHMDAIKIPGECVVVPQLPLSPNGKVADAELAETVNA
ncbi:class I adenylate-forming enzyme family protein [Streptomyces sp. 7N604]|uniref:class I adenylate-forming enzyme family protein n=1 Tax=Streptomyces sp. 7N604 TaxID=3457415 RepID=UPI003FD63AD0